MKPERREWAVSRYSDDVPRDLGSEYIRMTSELTLLLVRLSSSVASTLKMPRGKEYLVHGVCRRLQTIRRCLRDIFEAFPPEREQLLDDDERSRVEVALQAFLINLFGLFDNTAWVFLHEKKVSLKRNAIGLFLAPTQKHLPAQLVTFVTDPKIASWHGKYVKPYRDALAHRIPLYVPPMGLTEPEQMRFRELQDAIFSALRDGDLSKVEALQNEQGGLGSVLPVYVHSLSESEASETIWLHPQVLVDAKTAVAILNTAFPDQPPQQSSRQPKGQGA
jgi:hypothetical protein